MYDDSVLLLKQYREEKQQHGNRRYQEEQGSQYGLKGDGTNKKRSNSISCSSNDLSTTVKIRKLEGEEESSFIDADPGSAANPHNLLTKNRTSNSNKSYPKQMSQHQPLSRDEIEALAVSQGAKMGG